MWGGGGEGGVRGMLQWALLGSGGGEGMVRDSCHNGGCQVLSLQSTLLQLSTTVLRVTFAAINLCLEIKLRLQLKPCVWSPSCSCKPVEGHVCSCKPVEGHVCSCKPVESHVCSCKLVESRVCSCKLSEQSRLQPVPFEMC